MDEVPFLLILKINLIGYSLTCKMEQEKNEKNHE